MTSQSAFPLIGLTGRAGSGKTTVADYLDVYWDFHHFALAQPIKEAIEEMFWDEGLFEPACKESPIPGLGLSPRHLAQTLGTEWGRKLDPDFWIKILSHRMEQILVSTSGPFRAVVSDIRFDNEAKWIREQGGLIWKINGRANELVGDTAKHVSEAGISTEYITHDLMNSGSMDSLRQTIDSLVKSCYPSVFSQGKRNMKGVMDY